MENIIYHKIMKTLLSESFEAELTFQFSDFFFYLTQK